MREDYHRPAPFFGGACALADRVQPDLGRQPSGVAAHRSRPVVGLHVEPDVDGEGRAPEAPREHVLEALLDTHAPLTPVPLCPGISAFTARGLVEIWEAAEAVARSPLPSPFWAWAWPAGIALARLLLDEPARVRGRTVLDFGAGGGVASLACARAGAARVIANDIDPWATAVTRIAARRQGMAIETLLADLTTGTLPDCDVLLCADLGYERPAAPAERAVLDRARAAAIEVLVANAGRAYFDATGYTAIATHVIPVPGDLEGVSVRTATVYQARRT